MDYNKLALLGAQVIVFAGLTVLVGLGRDSAITDGLMAISGSIVGVGAYQTLSKK